MNHTLKRIHIGRAPVAMDLTDGSERGEYVSQDYILHALGRPVRSVNLMYCYYPLDKTFPMRARHAFADRSVSFQWDYPYDDYFPYTGGLNGTRNGEVFRQMQDIRRHGQNVTLTLTCDPHVSDDHLIAIAEDLRPYGRLMLRLNHEATGSWFAFSKRASFEEVAQFFVHASEVIRAHAPNVQTVICIGGIERPDMTEMVREREFACTLPAADIWSVDKYMALHWGWPYDTAKPGGRSHRRDSVKEIYELTKRSLRRFTELNGGQAKPLLMSEFNADGDVTGPYEQCDMVDSFFQMLKNDPESWLSGINFYQFRDRGRLGLETEDPSDPSNGIPQPVMQTFRKWLRDDLFMPRFTEEADIQLPVMLRWGGAEDAEGIAVTLNLEDNPHFCELNFSDEGNYMLELNGKWFYKAPQTRFVDLMPAFFATPVRTPCEMQLRLFAPPASGRNDTDHGDDLLNCFTKISSLPEIRIEYAPVEASRD